MLLLIGGAFAALMLILALALLDYWRFRRATAEREPRRTTGSYHARAQALHRATLDAGGKVGVDTVIRRRTTRGVEWGDGAGRTIVQRHDGLIEVWGADGMLEQTMTPAQYQDWRGI